MATGLKTSGVKAPDEFMLYRFCHQFHCLPADVDRMPDHLYVLFQAFMRAEIDADILRAKRQKQRTLPS